MCVSDDMKMLEWLSTWLVNTSNPKWKIEILCHIISWAKDDSSWNSIGVNKDRRLEASDWTNWQIAKFFEGV